VIAVVYIRPAPERNGNRRPGNGLWVGAAFVSQAAFR
jgi:hypothetical protein